jgi:hypothetical protein
LAKVFRRLKFERLFHLSTPRFVFSQGCDRASHVAPGFPEHFAFGNAAACAMLKRSCGAGGHACFGRKESWTGANGPHSGKCSGAYDVSDGKETLGKAKSSVHSRIDLPK